MLVLRLASSADVSVVEVRSVVLVVMVSVSAAQPAMLRTTAAIKLFARSFMSAF